MAGGVMAGGAAAPPQRAIRDARVSWEAARETPPPISTRIPMPPPEELADPGPPPSPPPPTDPPPAEPDLLRLDPELPWRRETSPPLVASAPVFEPPRTRLAITNPRKAPPVPPPVVEPTVGTSPLPPTSPVVEGLAEPREGECPPPRYPLRARRLGWEGEVEVLVLISAAGLPERVQVARSSGHAILDQAAVEAARSWKFSPAHTEGGPVATERIIPFLFVLRDLR